MQTNQHILVIKIVNINAYWFNVLRTKNIILILIEYFKDFFLSIRSNQLFRVECFKYFYEIYSYLTFSKGTDNSLCFTTNKIMVLEDKGKHYLLVLINKNNKCLHIIFFLNHACGRLINHYCVHIVAHHAEDQWTNVQLWRPGSD